MSKPLRTQINTGGLLGHRHPGMVEALREACARMRGGGLPAYARMRASAKREEGRRAFVGKRPPSWVR